MGHKARHLFATQVGKLKEKKTNSPKTCTTPGGRISRRYNHKDNGKLEKRIWEIGRERGKRERSMNVSKANDVCGV